MHRPLLYVYASCCIVLSLIYGSGRPSAVRNGSVGRHKFKIFIKTDSRIVLYSFGRLGERIKAQGMPRDRANMREWTRKMKHNNEKSGTCMMSAYHAGASDSLIFLLLSTAWFHQTHNTQRNLIYFFGFSLFIPLFSNIRTNIAFD